MKSVVLFFAVVAVLLCEVHCEDLQMRWCYNGEAEGKKCAAMKDAIQVAAKALNLTVKAACVNGGDNCATFIQENEADLVTMDSGDIMKAEEQVDPIVSERYADTGSIRYYAVAVAKKSNNITMKDLKNRKTCHTGARKNAGWIIPVGYMLDKDVIPRGACTQIRDFLAAANFFSKSCVPGISKFNQTGKIPSNLCAICKKDCSSGDAYANYGGAFKCMAEGAGEVAFVKHTTTKDEVDQGKLADYEYLCKDGTRKAIGQHKACNLGARPANAVVARKQDPHIEHHYVNILMKLVELYGKNQTNATDFQLFNSTKYGGEDLIFKDSAVGLDEITTKTVKGYMGDYYNDYKVLTCGEKITTTSKPATPTSKASALSLDLFMFLALVVAVLMKAM